MSTRSSAGDTLPQPLAVELGRAIADLRFDELEPASVAKAKLCVLDFLSCAFASAALPWSVQAIEVARAGSTTADTPDRARGAEQQADGAARGEDRPRGGSGSGNGGRRAGIIGTPHRVSLADAAFANAVLGHALVRDDMHVGSVSHLGVVVLPPLLAFAAHRPISGEQFVTALVAGYQVGGTIGRAILDVEVAKIFRPTGITGPLAGAAAAARVLGLSAGQAATAIAIAANTAAGYNEWAATGGSEMFFHPGFAARSAVTAVQLAAAGAYASPSALDGPAGLLAAFRKQRPETARRTTLEPPAAPREILDVFFKPVPACNYAQSAAQAAREIATRHAIDGTQVDDVEIRVPHAAAAYPGCDCAGPFEHALQAKMSIQYNVAAALVTGAFHEESYLPLEQPAIQRVAARCRLTVDDGLTQAYPQAQGAEVIVHGSTGERWQCRYDDVVPASEADVRARFAAAAAAALGRERAQTLAQQIETLETLAGTAVLSGLLQPDPGHGASARLRSAPPDHAGAQHRPR